MEVDYIKKRIIITEAVSIKRIVEEFAYLGLDEWSIVPKQDGYHLVAIADVDDWVKSDTT